MRKNEAHLKQTRAEAASELDNEAVILAKPHEILQFVSQVADFIKHSPPKDRKQMLKRFIKCVWIEPGKATIVYRIPLPNDAKRRQATELVLALDEPVPPTVHVSPCTRGFTCILRRHYGIDVATATELHRNDWDDLTWTQWCKKALHILADRIHQQSPDRVDPVETFYREDHSPNDRQGHHSDRIQNLIDQ